MLFIAPVTPLLQCDPNPMAVTSRMERSFILTGTRVLRPPELLADEPLLATTTSTSGAFSAFSTEEGDCCWGSTEALFLLRSHCSTERRIVKAREEKDDPDYLDQIRWGPAAFILCVRDITASES